MVQKWQRPQRETKDRITGSPGLTEVTPGADFLDYARAFVAQHRRQGHERLAGHVVPVAAADARRADFHQYLTLFGWVQVQLLHHQWAVRLIQDRRFCLHSFSLPSQTACFRWVKLTLLS